MKLIVFKYSRDKLKGGNNGKSGRINYERILFTAVIVAFSILVLAQAALMNNTARTFISDTARYEGIPLEGQNALFEEGKLVLELTDDIDGSVLKVLVNGDETGNFSSRVLELTVKNDDVVEIQNPVKSTVLKIKIDNASDNIKGSFKGKVFNMKEGINKLVRIRLK